MHYDEGSTKWLCRSAGPRLSCKLMTSLMIGEAEIDGRKGLPVFSFIKEKVSDWTTFSYNSDQTRPTTDPARIAIRIIYHIGIHFHLFGFNFSWSSDAGALILGGQLNNGWQVKKRVGNDHQREPKVFGLKKIKYGPSSTELMQSPIDD